MKISADKKTLATLSCTGKINILDIKSQDMTAPVKVYSSMKYSTYDYDSSMDLHPTKPVFIAYISQSYRGITAWKVRYDRKYHYPLKTKSEGSPRSLVFGVKSKCYYVSTGNKDISIISFFTNKIRANMKVSEHSNNTLINSIALTKDEKYAFVGHQNSCVNVFRCTGKYEMVAQLPYGSNVYKLDLSSKGNYLFAAGNEVASVKILKIFRVGDMEEVLKAYKPILPTEKVKEEEKKAEIKVKELKK